ncbi:MAG: MATE family efflux transporter [Dinoroseobacter sp.]|nr:MATE family efflux transporter [Dinoroseobacter sp.]
MTIQPLRYRAHVKSALFLALPLAGSHLAQSMVNVADTLMLGWYGVEALAAGVLGASTWFTASVLGSGFAFAVMPMVASAASAGDEVQVRRVTRMGLWLAILFGTLIYPVFWFSEPLLLALGQKPEIAGLAKDYLRIAGLGMVPALLVWVLKSYLAALERAQVVLWVTVAGAVGNAGLNWLLIFGNWGFPELGIKGAAWASVGLYLVMTSSLAVYALRVLPEHELFARFWRPDWEAFGKVFRLGWPIGFTHLAESGLFTAAAIMMGWIGTIPLAAHGIALQIASITFMVHLGLGQAATVRAGRALGRKDQINLMRGSIAITGLSLGTIFLTMVLFLGMPEFLIGVFTDPDGAQRAAVISMGVSLLTMAALFQLADGLQVLVLGLLRGVQDTRVPMIIAGFSYWAVGAPSGYIFGFIVGWGAVGIWFGLVVGLAVAAVLLSWRFWGQRHWTHRLIET